MKVLVVEDDKKQIKWCRKSFSDNTHSVIIAENYCDYEEMIKETEIDILITDLMIPYNTKTAETSLGLSIFKYGLTLLSEKRIKGLAMLSNYEHHYHKSFKKDGQKKDGQTRQFDMPEDEIIEVLDFTSDVFDRCGKKLSNQKNVRGLDELWDNDDHLEVIKSNLVNVIFLYDLNLTSYRFFLDLKSGEILKRKDAYERCNREWEKKMEEGNVRWMPYGARYLIPENYLLLKPYREVVDALLLK